ncbi:hypothetical protein ACJRO7_031961 [Eucalyptus globulus]|uniref:Uncharacterized protein n=1 Tax=Eucalyptus globulus TaxID=34317 RepID=A0ABD3JIE0_EUCGL
MGGTESRSREENGEATESSDTALANQSSRTSALAEAAVTGMAILALGVGVVSMMGESSQPSEEEKTMKAPGSRGADFENDPKTYFQNLRRGERKK